MGLVVGSVAKCAKIKETGGRGTLWADGFSSSKKRFTFFLM